MVWNEFKEQGGLKQPRRFYIVACPYCGATVNRACFQKKQSDRWYPPHMDRVKAAEADPRFQKIEIQKSAQQER